MIVNIFGITTIGTDPNLAAAYVSAGLPQFAASALSTSSAIGNLAMPSAGINVSISKQIEGEYKIPRARFLDNDVLHRDLSNAVANAFYVALLGHVI